MYRLIHLAGLALVMVRTIPRRCTHSHHNLIRCLIGAHHVGSLMQNGPNSEVAITGTASGHPIQT